MEDVSIIDLLLPLRGFAISNEVLKAMVFGEEFSPSRESYIQRNITYSQFRLGELQVIGGVKEWVDAIRKAAENIDSAVSCYHLDQAQ